MIEDQKGGFNLQVPDFNGQVIAHKKVLMVNHLEPPWPQHTDAYDDKTMRAWGYDEGVAWPPAPTKWETREVYVTEVRRIPAKLSGYCYGIRRVYADATDWTVQLEDLYDMSDKPWKVVFMFSRLHPNSYGDFFEGDSSNYVFQMIDLQNLHFTLAGELIAEATNHYAPPEFYNVKRYGMPGGLTRVMR